MDSGLIVPIDSCFDADVLGSPNGAHFVYDGDGDTTGAEGPPGSATIETLFQEDLGTAGFGQGEVFSEYSDHFGFFLAGIPYGGLFTGLDELMTAEEAAALGGTAGELYDSCYHLACDDIDNVDMDVLEATSRSMARAAQHLGIEAASL